MKENIVIDGSSLEYELRITKRSRSLRMSLDPEKGLVVIVPYGSRGSGKQIAERFIQQKSEWILKTFEKFKKNPATPTRRFTKKEIAEYSEQARALAAARLAYFNTAYKFTYRRISIRNQKTRWGSCSRKGNLNFNFRIILLPGPLADYIIVHELCHLGQMNHSPKFWKLVEKAIPDYLARRKALRTGAIHPS